MSLLQFPKRESSRDGRRSECKACKSLYIRQYYQNNKDQIKNTAVKYYLQHRDIILEQSSKYGKQYYSDHKEQIQAKNRRWCENNKDRMAELNRTHHQNNKEKRYIRNNEWCKNNKGYVRYKSAKKRAQKLKATMPGYDKELKEIYKNCPQGYHVDHIIPLVHPKVSGLHVPWNLQYLTAEDNIRKSNKVEGL